MANKAKELLDSKVEAHDVRTRTMTKEELESSLKKKKRSSTDPIYKLVLARKEKESAESKAAADEAETSNRAGLMKSYNDMAKRKAAETSTADKANTSAVSDKTTSTAATDKTDISTDKSATTSRLYDFNVRLNADENGNVDNSLGRFKGVTNKLKASNEKSGNTSDNTSDDDKKLSDAKEAERRAGIARSYYDMSARLNKSEEKYNSLEAEREQLQKDIKAETNPEYKSEMQKKLDEISKEASAANQQTNNLISERTNAEYKQTAARNAVSAAQLAKDARSSKDYNSATLQRFDYNSSKSYVAKAFTGEIPKAETDIANPYTFLNYLDDDEKNVVKYYLVKGDNAKAEKYVESIKSELDERKNADINKWLGNVGTAGNVALNVAGSFAAPLSMFSAVKNAISGATTGYYDNNTNSTEYFASNLENQTSQNVSNNVYKAALESTGSEKWANVASQFAGIGLSILQNTARMPIAMYSEPLSLLVMSTGVAGNIATDAISRGGNYSQALVSGFAQGAVEYLTEKMPLDNLMEIISKRGKEAGVESVSKILKNMLADTGKQTVIEGTEEIISEIADNIIDKVAMGDLSEYEQYVKYIMEKDGVSEKEARYDATIQYYVTNVFWAGLGGAVSGGVMAGGANALSAAANIGALNKSNSNDGQNTADNSAESQLALPTTPNTTNDVSPETAATPQNPQSTPTSSTTTDAAETNIVRPTNSTTTENVSETPVNTVVNEGKNEADTISGIRAQIDKIKANRGTTTAAERIASYDTLLDEAESLGESDDSLNLVAEIENLSEKDRIVASIDEIRNNTTLTVEQRKEQIDQLNAELKAAQTVPQESAQVADNTVSAETPITVAATPEQTDIQSEAENTAQNPQSTPEVATTTDATETNVVEPTNSPAVENTPQNVTTTDENAPQIKSASEEATTAATKTAAETTSVDKIKVPSRVIITQSNGKFVVKKTGTLSDGEFTRLKKAMTEAGGKYSSAVGGFVFDSNPASILDGDVKDFSDANWKPSAADKVTLDEGNFRIYNDGGRYIVKADGYIDKPAFNSLREKMESIGGVYDKTERGFVFTFNPSGYINDGDNITNETAAAPVETASDTTVETAENAQEKAPDDSKTDEKAVSKSENDTKSVDSAVEETNTDATAKATATETAAESETSSAKPSPNKTIDFIVNNIAEKADYTVALIKNGYYDVARDQLGIIKDYADEKSSVVSAEAKQRIVEAYEKARDAYKAAMEAAPQPPVMNGLFKGRIVSMDTMLSSGAKEDTANKKIAAGMDDNERYEILKNKSLTVTKYNGREITDSVAADITTVKDKYAREVAPILKRLAEQFNIFGAYDNRDIDISFDFSRNSLTESIHKQNGNYDEFAKMLSVLRPISENAIGIEQHKDRYSNGKNTAISNVYVFVSAFDDDGIIPIRLTVKEYTDKNKPNKLYVAISLNKMEASVFVYDSDASNTSESHTPLASSISIPQFFAGVNPSDGKLLKYIPDNFLSPEQYEGKNNAIADEAAYNKSKHKKQNNDSERKDNGNDGRILGEENNTDVSGVRQEGTQSAEESGNVENDAEKDSSERGGGVSKSDGVADGTQLGESAVQHGESDTDSSVISGANESGNSNGNDGTGNNGNDSRVTTPRKNKNNYSFDTETRDYIENKRPNYKDNIEAIKLLRQIQREGRVATTEERAALAKFKGWGGLKNAFEDYYTSRELKGILTADEYAEAKRSTLNAHYTSLDVVDAMYKGLQRMGFKGGALLEPSMGVGNFFGEIPKTLSGKTDLYGVEMDSITGQIAQLIYPDARISISPYQDVQYKDGSFDAAISNVPFLNVSFPYKRGKYMLHDYYFVKTLDKVKDGGIVMFITSTGTLDKIDSKARDAIAERANLVAAYRMPGSAFKTIAGTEVTTDLLIFQKRPSDIAQSGETFANVGEIEKIPINEYYTRHPQNILGKLVYEKGMYAEDRTQVQSVDGVNFIEQLNHAMGTLPKNIVSADMTATEVTVENEQNKPQFIRQGDSIYFSPGGKEKPTAYSGKPAARISGYLDIKDAFNNIMTVSADPNATQQQKDAARKQLNSVYDKFVGTFGALNISGNSTQLRSDGDFWRISGLERAGEKEKTFVKSDIFTKDTLSKKEITSADTAEDALAISLTAKGAVDMKYMQELTKRTEDRLVSDLNGKIILTPDGDYQLIDIYLSGNIREKIAAAEKAAENNPAYKKNVDALKAAMPTQAIPQDITPQFGASWIKPEIYEAFFKDTFDSFNGKHVLYDKTTGTWQINGRGYMSARKYYSVDIDFDRFIGATINMKSITIRDSDKKVDVAATERVRQLQESLRRDFAEWAFKDSSRRTELVNTYNILFNSYRNMDYNTVGQYLRFENLSKSFNPRDYQKGAVARVIFGGDTLLAHGVGTGKTAEMVISAMELKRMGITHKNMFVVPNQKVGDFRNEVIKLYPDAKVLMAEERDFKKENRAKLFAKIATNDIDIVIIGHSQFKMIPVSKQTQQNYIENELRLLDEVWIEARNADQRDGRFLKQLERSKMSLESKLKELANMPKDETVTFEEMGADGLFVDEAHNFKNLPYYTKLNVAGAGGAASQRAQDMFMKTTYLHGKNSRVVFATATPITNSLSEIYNMTRFVSPQTLDNAGMQSFDAWASNFGTVENKVEMSSDGVSFRMKERFSKFSNVRTMTGLFRQMADILKTADVIKDLPKAKHVTVECESNEYQEKYISMIQYRVNSMGGRGGKSDNMLLVTNDGRAAATDLRLVAKQLNIDPSELDLLGSKVNRTVENVMQEYKDSDSIKGTQLVFLDFGKSNDPDARYGFNLYSDIVEKLVKSGIPKSEIAIIDNYDTIEKKDKLFKQVNEGEVRVLIGSTARMGEGMNVQNRLVALHHLNAPYRPSDIEQREGRIIRYKNMNKDVRIYRYIQKRSFDSYMWQMLERKATFINQAMNGQGGNEIEDVDEFVLSAQECKAIASGNPLLMEKMELDDKKRTLEARKSNYDNAQWEAQDTAAKMPQVIEADAKNIDKLKADLDTIDKHPKPEKGVDITINGKKYDNRDEAGNALIKAMNDGRLSMDVVHEIGKISGLQLKFKQSGAAYTMYLSGEANVPVTASESGTGNITRLYNALDTYGDRVKGAQNKLETDRKALANAKETLSKPFEDEAEYQKVLAALTDINTKLQMKAGAMGEIIDDTGMDDDFKTEDELVSDEDNTFDTENASKEAAIEKVKSGKTVKLKNKWTIKRSGARYELKGFSESDVADLRELGVTIEKSGGETKAFIPEGGDEIIADLIDRYSLPDTDEISADNKIDLSNAIKTAQGIASKYGISVELASRGEIGANGKFDSDTNTIYVADDASSEEVFYRVFAHELTHPAESFDTRLINDLRPAMETFYGKDAVKKKIADTKARYIENYVKQGKTRAEAESIVTDIYAQEEVTCEFIGDLFSKDADEAAQFLSDNAKPSVLRRILDAIERFISKLTGDVTTAAKQYMRNLADAIRRFAQMETGEVVANTRGGEAEQNGSRYSLADSDSKYMSAVESGDMAAAQQMVNDAAEKSGAYIFEGEERNNTVFEIRTKPVPKSKKTVYKLFDIVDGNPSALYIDKATPKKSGDGVSVKKSTSTAIPVGVWLDGKEGEWHYGSNGRKYVYSKLGDLSYRPGWHASSLPLTGHIGDDIADVPYGKVKRPNQVYYVCEIDADNDYQGDVEKRRNEEGDNSLGLDRLPTDGYYEYKTNTNASDDVTWYISGAIRLVRPMSETEVNAILDEHGLEHQLWETKKGAKLKAEQKTKENATGSLDLEANKINSTEEVGNYGKILDPVTYDDNGKVIPLSQRFNASKSDVRYSIEDSEFSANTNKTAASMGIGTISESEAAQNEDIRDNYFTPEEMKEYQHSVKSDKKSLESAEKRIKYDGYQASVDYIVKRAMESGAPSKEDSAVAQVLMNTALSSGDTRNIQKLLWANVQFRTAAGQALQSMKLIKKLSPEGKLYMLQQSVEKTNRELLKQYGKKFSPIEIPEDLADALLKAKTPAAQQRAIDDIEQYVADHIPVSTWDKLNNIRYMCMLCNPRTHVRNTVGNAIFKPVVTVKDAVGATIELIAVRDKSARTKTFKRPSKETRNYARSAFDIYEKEIRGESKYDLGAGVNDKRKIFKSKILEGLRKTNSNLLEKEDAFFLKGYFVSTLAREMTVRNMTVEDIQSGKVSQNMVNSMVNNAIKEAQRNTYRDASELASTLNKISKKHKVAGFFIEGLLPFKKTPINILKRGIEYSPAGIIKGVSELHGYAKNYSEAKENLDAAAKARKEAKTVGEKLSANADIEKAQMAYSQTKETLGSAIDSLSCGLTGTALMVLGALLSSMGLLALGGDDDKEDKYKDDLGLQEWALQIGDTSVTLDWAAPSVLPLFSGAALYESIRDVIDKYNENGEMFNAEDLSKILLDQTVSVLMPVTQMSMLSSVNDLLESVSYADTGTETALNAALTTATSYPTQFIPTIFGQVARTMDTTRRSSKAFSGNNIPNDMEYAINRIKNRIPGLSFTSQPYVDVWGNTQDNGEDTASWTENMLENFVLPGYIDTFKADDKVNTEIINLYQNTGDDDVIPTHKKANFTSGGKTINMTADEYTDFQTTCGQTSYNLIGSLVTKDKYKSLSDTDKAATIKAAYGFAYELAKYELMTGRGEDYSFTAKYLGRWCEHFMDNGSYSDIANACLNHLES